MSRFSKAEAEARGWSFFHSQDEETVNLGNGVTRTKPASLRAERYVSRPGQANQLVSEEAETIGKLLERINHYEVHVDSLPDYTPSDPPVDPPLPSVLYDHTVPEGENPIVPHEDAA